jgi:hypothetical protein
LREPPAGFAHGYNTPHWCPEKGNDAGSKGRTGLLAIDRETLAPLDARDCETLMALLNKLR